MKCIACGEMNWIRLPDPHPQRSVTTSGNLVDQPLAKSHCAQCGLVQRTDAEFLGNTDFYENHYSFYYERPGLSLSQRQRYQEMADFVASGCKSATPKTILEVGCGRGWTMRELARNFPEASIEGIEPAIENSKLARESGHAVHTGKLENYRDIERRFDLIYSNHVIQHTTDPVEFLADQKRLLAPGGRIVVTVQDASYPSNELLYSDQNFAYLPRNLASIANSVGLKVIEWIGAPDSDAVKFSQLIAFAPEDDPAAPEATADIPQPDIDALYERRRQYLSTWSSLDDELCQRTAECNRKINFGAGMFTFILATYCEKYWDSVSACTADGEATEFAEKQVIPFSELEQTEDTCIILGVRPRIQDELFKRLEGSPATCIRWDDFLYE